MICLTSVGTVQCIERLQRCFHLMCRTCYLETLMVGFACSFMELPVEFFEVVHAVSRLRIGL